jgi:hypothetical protein
MTGVILVTIIIFVGGCLLVVSAFAMRALYREGKPTRFKVQGLPPTFRPWAKHDAEYQRLRRRTLDDDKR